MVPATWMIAWPGSVRSSMKRISKFLSVGLVVLAVLCLTVAFLYKETTSKPAGQPLILTPAVINHPLPEADLVNLSGTRLSDERLRHGKVVLVFTLTTCKPCDQENEFLKTVINIRNDISFFYVIPMGIKTEVLRQAQDKYCLETFFDQGSMLAKKLEVYQVPIKVFLEDGIIKKIWVEATVTDQRRSEFQNWLNGL
jgi:hypothetical protein